MTTIFDEGSTEVLAMAINILAETQKLIRVGEHSWQGLPTKDDVRQYAFALCGEVHELANELGWRDWRLPRPVDPERATDEHADVLAFMGILMQYTMDLANLSATQLAEGYRAKTQVNLERVAGRVQGFGGYQVQAMLDRGMGPKGLVAGHYYNIKDPAHNWDYFALMEGYDAVTDLYHFRDIITGGSQRLSASDPSWSAEVVGAKVAGPEPAAAAAGGNSGQPRQAGD